MAVKLSYDERKWLLRCYWKVENVVKVQRRIKSRRSRIVDLRHVKEAQAEIRASEQFLPDFSRSLQKATLMTWDVKSVVKPKSTTITVHISMIASKKLLEVQTSLGTPCTQISGSEFSWTKWNTFGEQVSNSVKQSIVTDIKKLCPFIC